MASEAKSLIDFLHGVQGLSYSAIGRALNRDSSLISQIAKGKKPGKNLVGGLEKLSKGEKRPAEPERRKTAKGEVAKVRQPKQPKAKALVKDKEGRIRRTDATAKERVFVSRLTKVANSGGKVSFIITHDGGEAFHLFRKGGIYAQKALYEILNNPDGAFAQLIEWALSIQGNGKGGSLPDGIGEIEGVEINAVY